MHTYIEPMTDAHLGLGSAGAERLREAALGASAALLAVAFLLLLAADQAPMVAGAF